MELAYWITAGLLAVFYLYAGGKKIAQSQEQLQPMMGWVDRVPILLFAGNGLINQLLEPFGIHGPSWISNPNYAKPADSLDGICSV